MGQGAVVLRGLWFRDGARSRVDMASHAALISEVEFMVRASSHSSRSRIR